MRLQNFVFTILGRHLVIKSLSFFDDCMLFTSIRLNILSVISMFLTQLVGNEGLVFMLLFCALFIKLSTSGVSVRQDFCGYVRGGIALSFAWTLRDSSCSGKLQFLVKAC